MQRLCIPVLCCVIGNLEFHPTVTSILVTSLITGCSFYWLGLLLVCDIREHRLAGVLLAL